MQFLGQPYKRDIVIPDLQIRKLKLNGHRVEIYRLLYSFLPVSPCSCLLASCALPTFNLCNGWNLLFLPVSMWFQVLCIPTSQSWECCAPSLVEKEPLPLRDTGTCFSGHLGNCWVRRLLPRFMEDAENIADQIELSQS